MMKHLKNRHLTATDSDAFTVRLLRQEWTANESQHTLGSITDDEYMMNLQTLDAKITALEDKYGLE